MNYQTVFERRFLLKKLPEPLTRASEHLQILDQLESGQFETAADLMRAHLRLSARQRPLAASRGVPTLSNRSASVTGL